MRSALSCDSKEIVLEVEKYRMDNRPEKVRVVLLAESHSHTSREDFERLLKKDFRRNDDMRCHYVNYVYCIGNSESYAMEDERTIKRRTSQFWRILYSCLHKVRTNDDLSSNTWRRRKERLSRLLCSPT